MLIRQIQKRNRAVVSVKIQEHPAGPQHAVPLPVRGSGILKRPGEVARNHSVKTCGFKLKATGVHALKGHIAPGLPGKGRAFVQHGLGHVHAADTMSLLCQQNGKKSGPGAHIKDVQWPCLWQMGHDFRQPQGFFLTGKLMTPYFAIAFGPARPVVFYAARERRAGDGQGIRGGAGGVCNVLAHKNSFNFAGSILLSHSRPNETELPNSPVFARRGAKRQPARCLRPVPQCCPDA